MTSGPAYLLTGFPAFGAKKMCGELVRARADAEVFAVTREGHAIDAEAARAELLPRERARVHLIGGDAAALDMGLSGAEYMDLARRITHVHHMAMVSDARAARATAEAVNIGATREVLEFATTCERLQCVGIHSTARVAGDRQGLLREDELDRGQAFRNAVEETAARAEKLARGWTSRVPLCILRPTTVGCDSRDGDIDRQGSPYALVALFMTRPPELGALGGLADAPLHLVPVDYVVRAARAIVEHAGAPGRTFHLAEPAPETVRRVLELVVTVAGSRASRAFSAVNLRRALLRGPGALRHSEGPRALVESLATRTTIDTSGTDELLAGTDVRCPPFESYVDKLVDHVQTWLREERERAHEEKHETLA